MTSTARLLVQRVWPLVAFAAHGPRRDAATRAVLAALAEDVVTRVEDALAALAPEDAGEDVARELERCRQRLRAAAGEVACAVPV